MIDTRIRIITIIGAVGVLLIVLDLVRRRKLKEEYSVLWVVTAIVVLVLAIWYDLLTSITSLVGATAPASTIFFFGLLFFLVLMLHFSVRISTLERRLTELIQDVGINDVEAASVDARLQVKSRAEQEQPL
jgi:hypothetical protein